MTLQHCKNLKSDKITVSLASCSFPLRKLSEVVYLYIFITGMALTQKSVTSMLEFKKG